MLFCDEFQVEPGTRLFPAVIAEPTIKEMLQFELGANRVKLHALSIVSDKGKYIVISPDKKRYPYIYFSYFSMKTYVVVTH